MNPCQTYTGDEELCPIWPEVCAEPVWVVDWENEAGKQVHCPQCGAQMWVEMVTLQ